MSNNLSPEKQVTAITSLAEGNSIRSVERMTGIHLDTIMRLSVRVGEGCAKIMDSTMRNLDCRLIQMDEIWGFVGKKNKNVSEADRREGFSRLDVRRHRCGIAHGSCLPCRTLRRVSR